MSDKKTTNVMRIAESSGIEHYVYTYEAKEALSGMEVSRVINKDPEQMFKTLVTVGKSKEHYVFMVPVNEELNLKKAALAVGEKSIEMIKQKELLPLTGYIHGGCSPIGMKKQFKTTIHETAILYDTIIFSAGAIGAQIEMSLEGLKSIIDVSLEDIT